MSSTYLTRTPSSSGNRNKWTFSAWVKRSQTSAEEVLFSCYQSNDYYTFLRFEANGTIKFRDNYTGNANLNLDTNAVYRDTSGWYHVVAVYDKDNSTSADKAILYINGERVTSFSNATYPSNASTWNVDNLSQRIGSLNTSQYWNGSMSHINFIDGTAYDASAFGETDATTGQWKIKTSPSVTYGTNGFFILKDGNSVTDQSGEGNNFTVGGGTLTDTKDCPSNVFATGNRLNVNTVDDVIFANGNNTIEVANSSGFQFGSSTTLGMTTGKFYCEAKIITVDATMVGVSANVAEDARDNYPPGVQGGAQSVAILVSTGNKYIDDSGSTYGAALSANDILMIALDLDNLKVYFGSGGQWANGSGAWNQAGLTSGAAISITAVASTAEGAYFFSFGDGGGSAKGKVSWNFGNGTFGTSTVSSAGTAGSTPGTFEYDVPSGYEPLSTKGLNA